MNGFRLLEITEPIYPYKLQSSKDAHKAVKDYGRADREVFVVLFLDAKNMIKKCEPLSIGAVDSAAVYPGEVVKSALLNSVSSIICAHNHPSGDCTPSGADLEITAQIMLACSTVGIRVLDHIILGRECFLSMADSGKLSELQDKVNSALASIRGAS
ncbi:RadC family protein [Acidobacteriota bacterium]